MGQCREPGWCHSLQVLPKSGTMEESLTLSGCEMEVGGLCCFISFLLSRGSGVQLAGFEF